MLKACLALLVGFGLLLPLSVLNRATLDMRALAQPARGLNRQIVVTVAKVVTAAPRERVQAIGTAKAVRQIDVTADVAGTIETIHFTANKSVDAGEPLIALERQTQEIALGSAKASFAKERAALARYEELSKRSSGVVTQVQMDEARANFAGAEAQLAAAQYEFDRRIIRAPFAGQVNLTDLAIGSYLPAGAAIVTLSDTSKLHIEFNVSENAAAAIAIGVEVRMLTPTKSGRPFFGKITAFDNAIDATARTIRVRAELENSDGAILPGATFSVSLQPKSEPLPVVPAVSITWSRDGAFVWRLDDDGKPERVPVTIRRRDKDQVWVEADLQAGDRIIEDGALKVREGSPIRVKSEANESKG